ncbi:MAG: F0F1 ATP synthase subunit A [Patescibacteria group bacterium]|nr:F0F1 ATP synthase subunit A [Patescibacteria group bacterium]
MVSFAAEPVIRLGFFTVTNSFLDTLLVDTFLVVLIIAFNKKNSLVPGLFQNFVEMVIETAYSLTESVASERAAKIFPFFASFFLFILIANWSGLIPGFSTVGFYEGHKLIPILRAATSDFNVTFGLAIVSAFATHILSVRTIGIKDYLSRYLSFNPIYLFVGFLEIISEFTKVISLSFRLFGNIYAGEVVLGTVSTIFAFVFPLPFLMLEVIVGLIQALVFSMLTMAFMSILTTPHHKEAKEVSRR